MRDCMYIHTSTTQIQSIVNQNSNMCLLHFTSFTNIGDYIAKFCQFAGQNRIKREMSSIKELDRNRKHSTKIKKYGFKSIFVLLPG